MRELYRMIEELIKESGYPGEIDGSICRNVKK